MSALAEDMMAALCGQRLLCLFAERASLVAYSMCARNAVTLFTTARTPVLSQGRFTPQRVSQDYAHERTPSEA